VVVDREVLAELEGLEPIDDQLVYRWAVFHHPGMKEHTVTAKTGDVPVDRLGGYFQIPGYLAVGHPAGCFHDDLGIQIGALLVVGG
jgi:hypothetical protein